LAAFSARYNDASLTLFQFYIYWLFLLLSPSGQQKKPPFQRKGTTVSNFEYP